MLTDSARETINEVVASHKQMPGALLPILHGIQDAVGYIPAEAVDSIARELNLSRAEVHGVVTYYHHFRSEPRRATLVRNGSRGLFWLEPMVEVATPQGRVAYGPVTPATWPAVRRRLSSRRRAQALKLGLTEEIPLPEEAGAPDLRPHGHHRSAVAGRLRGA
jgi:hypothetical protein